MSDEARSLQWSSLTGAHDPRPPRRVECTIAAPTLSAPSHVALETTGDHPTRTMPGVSSTVPLGSKSNVHPTSRRAGVVAASTSGFVDVLTTAPRAASTLGMMTDEVLPERDGPSTSVERSGPEKAQPEAPNPR